MALRNFTSITLRDGRKLAFREYGLAQGGLPVVFLHGNLNSRLLAPAWAHSQELTAGAGCRVLALDRPGYGDSCFLADRTYADMAADVTELLDHLQLDRAAIVGYSSGGPNAMACAAHMQPSRVTALGLLSPDGPYCLMGASVVQQVFHMTEEEVAETAGGPRALTPAMTLLRAQKSHQDLAAAYGSISKLDRRELALADLEHAALQGLDKGPAQDALLESAPWDFTLEQLKEKLEGTPCLLWHGEDDSDVPVSVAHYLAGVLPAADVRIVPGESHSMIRRKWGEFLSALVTSVETAAPVPIEKK